MKSGIYKIQSKIKPERFYIGSAVDISKRWRDHKRDLLNGKHHSPKLQNHVNKYRLTDFEFSVVEECEKEDLLKMEQKHMDADFPFFNTLSTAGSWLGMKHSPETRKKISEAHKGLNTWNKGRKASPETRNKMSEANKGRKYSEETRRKIGEAGKGRIPWNKGKKHSKETRRKISEANKGRVPWNKGKKKSKVTE